MDNVQIIGRNPKSGGGTIIVSSQDENGVELMDLSSGEREKLEHGAESVAFPGVTAPAGDDGEREQGDGTGGGERS